MSSMTFMVQQHCSLANLEDATTPNAVVVVLFHAAWAGVIWGEDCVEWTPIVFAFAPSRQERLCIESVIVVLG